MSHFLFEACVETLEEAIKAEEMGAHRLELCSRLDLDGLTPSLKLSKLVFDSVKIPIKIMIRLKSGNFIYNDSELEVLKDQIKKLQSYASGGFVFGAIKDGSLDIDAIDQICKIDDAKAFTIHKAIDQSKTPLDDIELLKAIPNITSILSSGKANTAVEGISLLSKMKTGCGSRLKLIVAGKVTQDDIQLLYQQTGAIEFHGKKIMENKKGR